MAKIENVASRAEQETEKYQDKCESNLRRTSGIREYRATEKEQRRELEAFELKDNSKALPSPEKKKIKEEVKPSKSTQSTQPNHLDLLARKRRERKGGK